MKMNERTRMEDTLLQLASVLREKACARYLLTQESYQRRIKDTCDADQAYMMLDLTDQQRKIIDDMLDKRELASCLECTWSYLLGMLDAVLFLRETGFLELFLEDTEITKELTKAKG